MSQRILLLTLLSYVFLASRTQALIDMKDRLKNRVIHIESLLERGRWLWQNDNTDDDGSRYLFFDPLPERDTYYTPRVQFETTVCGDDKYLCLEPLSLRNYYFTAGFPAGATKYTVKLQYSVYTEDDDRFHWKIQCLDDSLEKCKVIPVRFERDGYILVTDDWGGAGYGDNHYDATLGKDETIGWFRVHAPNPTDGYNEIYRNTNMGNTPQSVTFQTSIGVTQTETTTETITSSTSTEIGGAFRAFSASVSTTIESSWQTTSSETFQASKTVSHKLTLQPRTTIVLRQLIGNYDNNFDVGDDAYEIEEIPLDAQAPHVFKAFNPKKPRWIARKKHAEANNKMKKWRGIKN